MPVLVTAAETELGQAVVRRLLATGGEVRAFGGPDTPTQLLRQAGAVCATGSLLDEGHLETAMEQVHTVVHLGVRLPGPSAETLVEETATVVSAAVGAGVRRLVATSLAGARPGAHDPIRRAAAEVESLVAAAPTPTVVVRPSLVDTPQVRHALGRLPLSREVLAHPVAPVRVEDLAELIAWIDDVRDVASGEHVVLAADGPETRTLDEHLRAIGITPMSAIGRLVERLRTGESGALLEALDGPWTSGTEVRSAWDASGVLPRPV